MTSEQGILWLAGLLEGEGCFRFGKWASKGNGCQITVEMTDEDVIVKAAEVMGTKVYFHKPRRLGCKPTWYTGACGDKAAAIARQILPFMGQRRKAKIEELLKRSVMRMTPHEIMANARKFSPRGKKRDRFTIELPLELSKEK